MGRGRAGQTDYWLVQYQRLMDQKPQRLIDQVSTGQGGVGWGGVGRGRAGRGRAGQTDYWLVQYQRLMDRD